MCRDGAVLVFVEVKASGAGALVPGYHPVDARKKRVLRRAIDAYLAGLAAAPETFRLDVVEVAIAAGEAGPVANRRFCTLRIFRSFRNAIAAEAALER